MARRPRSLGTRLLVLTTLVLIVAFTGTIGLLDMLFRQTSENAIRDLLDVQVLTLLGAAELGADGRLILPADLPEARLNSLSSGLFAEVVDPVGKRVWRSPSALGVDVAQGLAVAPGERLYTRRILSDDSEVLVLGIGITWDLVGDADYGFQVFVGQDLTAYQQRLGQFRRQLLGWFTAVMLTLILTIWWLLKSGLRPLARMEREIAAIESGDAELLGDQYPRELSGVARNLNALVRSERQRIGRFRTTMDDLAHSLKTPLAVLRSELDAPAPDSGVLCEQARRMQGVVDYQLRRAAATGPRTLAPKPVRIAPICREVASSLRKIHTAKDVVFEQRVADALTCRVEQGDLYELIGNLLDNAWKWCRARVSIEAAEVDDDAARLLCIAVCDDGPGIAPGDADRVLGRGQRGAGRQRGDVPGQGIGLAVVAEIVALYDGVVRIQPAGEEREFPGTRIELRLPLRDAGRTARR